MKNDLKKNNALFQASHMMILVTYTGLFVALAAEDFLMGWEKWPLILILAAVGFCWYAHLQQRFSDKNRLTLYVACMMATLFFYGIHLTSMFDLAVVMCATMVLCTTTGIKGFITVAQITYFVTMAYDTAATIRVAPETFDSLVISRAILHVLLIMIVGWLSRIIVDRWFQVLDSTEEEVAQLTETTERLNEFLTSVSHEIRTPINAVIGLSGTCLDRTEDETQRENLLAIQAAGKRVAEQISDILDYSEIDRRRVAVNLEDYTISSVLHDLVMELKPYEKDGVELVIDVDPGIPAVMNTDVGKLKKILWHLITNALKFTKEGGVYVRVTCERQDYGINLLLHVYDTGVGMTGEELERVFDGFYQSRETHTRSTGGLGLGLSIVKGFVAALGGFARFESRPGEGTSAHVSLPQKVVDPSGCMSVRNHEQLVLGGYLNFDKFPNPIVREYYNRMVRDIVRGLGVPLHRVDTLENLHKLQENVRMTHLFVGVEEYETDPAYMERLAETLTVIVVADERFVLPAGSRAHVMEKPFYCFPVAEALNRMPGEAVTDKYLHCRGVRALVVDDEPLNLTVARDVLSRYGIEVFTAASGQEAIEMCAQELYDVVFMDHMMPGMDGIEALRRIRADTLDEWKSIPVVALTANAVSTAREAFRAAGFDGFVAKPIDRMELERVLRAVLPKNKVSMEDAPFARPTKAKPAAAPPKPDAPAPPQDAYAPLRAVGVDIRQGLGYCQNDDEFYETLLKQFAGEAVWKRADLERFFAAEDLPNYAIYIHALKSTAKMIGANALSEQAKALEFAAKDGRAEDVQAGHARAMADYDALTDAIAAAFGGAPAAPEQEETEALEFAPEDGDVLEFDPDEGVKD